MHILSLLVKYLGLSAAVLQLSKQIDIIYWNFFSTQKFDYYGINKRIWQKFRSKPKVLLKTSKKVMYDIPINIRETILMALEFEKLSF